MASKLFVLTFETPWLGLSVAMIVLVVVGIFRVAAPDRKRWWHLLLPVALAAGAFALDYFVKTDYEKVKATLRQGRDLAVAEDADRLADLIAPEYRDPSHRSKEDLISFLRSFFKGTRIAKAPRRSRQIVMSEDSATAELLYRVHLEPNSAYAEAPSMYFVKVRFTLKRMPDGRWLFVRTELREVDSQPFNWGDL